MKSWRITATRNLLFYLRKKRGTSLSFSHVPVESIHHILPSIVPLRYTYGLNTHTHTQSVRWPSHVPLFVEDFAYKHFFCKLAADGGERVAS